MDYENSALNYKRNKKNSALGDHDRINQFNNFGVGSRKGKGNNYNAKEYLVTPQKNMLLFFPSYLWHTILNNHSDKPRYSLAFNLIPLGQYGSGDSTYNTEWFEK